MMEYFAYLRGNGHEIVISGCKNVDRSDNFGLRELPDV